MYRDLSGIDGVFDEVPYSTSSLRRHCAANSPVTHQVNRTSDHQSCRYDRTKSHEGVNHNKSERGKPSWLNQELGHLHLTRLALSNHTISIATVKYRLFLAHRSRIHVEFVQLRNTAFDFNRA